MDKIAQEIFAPLLASMAGKPLTRAIDNYAKVQALAKRCTVRVDRLHTTVHVAAGGADVYFDRSGYLTDDQTQRAIDLLLDDPAVMEKLDIIANKLARGELV